MEKIRSYDFGKVVVKQSQRTSSFGNNSQPGKEEEKEEIVTVQILRKSENVIIIRSNHRIQSVCAVTQLPIGHCRF